MRCFLIVFAILLSSGCHSRLKVWKVPAHCRAAGTDTEIKGFRYYLSRPYVIVKKPILVSETVEHVLAEADSKTGGVAVQEGSNQGTIFHARVPQTQILNNSGTRRLNDTEAATLRRVVEEGGHAERHQPMQQASFNQANAAQPDTGLMDTVASGVGTQLKSPTPDDYHFAGGGSTTSLVGGIQIVFLPDLDEQYAIHNKSILAKSAFRFRFKDGWQLTDVGAEHDSTTVAIELLNLIDSAVDSAKTLGLARVERASKLAADGGTMDDATSGVTISGRRMYELVRSTYIRPGIYRLNKPWETDEPPTQGEGLLVQLGLDLMVFTQVREPSALSALPTAEGRAADQADKALDGERGPIIRLPEVIETPTPQ